MAVVYRQPVLKSLEVVAKLALAVVMALLLWRPWRRIRLAGLTSARKILVVRIDRRVGEVLLTTPLLRHLEGLHVDFLVHPDMVRVAKGLPGVAEVLSFERTLGTVRHLRARRYDVVINAANWTAPSVTSAIVSRLVAPHGVVLGPATPPASWLMDMAVPPAPETPGEAAQ
ncbi:MAG: heptosyltransferase, partial [Archangium sp.]|nr:heptosyltransferase [Archangium sp.]